MKSRVLSYWLLISLAFVLTQPVATAFANWDAPYGLYKDLAEWMACAGAFLLLVTVYGLIQWKRKRLGLIHPLGAGALALVIILLGYWAEGFIRGEMGYGSPNIAVFTLGGFFGLALALMLFPVALSYTIRGGFYYPYDRPLVAAWLVSLAVSIVLSVAYVKTRKGERIKEPDTPAP